MRFFYKHYSQTDIASLIEGSINFRDISPTLNKIYLILMLSAIMAIVGAVLNLVFLLGTTVNGLNFILTISWLYSIEKKNQLHMFLTLLATSLFFGATTTSLMSSVFSHEERDIIIFFWGVALLFCFHLFALRTHNIKVIYQINYFTLPLFIFSMVISLHFVSRGVFPHDLLFVIPFVVVVPVLWHLTLWVFRDKIWTWVFWVRIHLYLLTLLSIFSNYHVFYLMGIYVFLLCVLANLKLHTIDSINLASRSDEHAPLPVSLSLTFFTEFLGRLSYMFIYSGHTLYQHLWEANHIVVRQIWQTCCTLCVQVFDLSLFFLWKSFDYIITIFRRVWDSVCAYYGRFKDGMVLLMIFIFGVVLLSIFAFLFFALRV